MRIYFLNKEIADQTFTADEVQEMLKQIHDNNDYIALYKGDRPYFVCKVSQINYIR